MLLRLIITINTYLLLKEKLINILFIDWKSINHNFILIIVD